jgi:spore coat polysaccharide biosynthesis protein SpsF
MPGTNEKRTGTRRVSAIIQARMGSTRLPAKTLADIEGKPLLAHIVERVSASKTIAEVAVATTIAPQDEAIVDLARGLGLPHYRGSGIDVLDRYYQAAKLLSADVIVRITPDDPFKDPDIIDLVVEKILVDPQLDYASNTIKPTFPEGLDVEAFTFRALERAWDQATLASEREHVTPHIWKHPDAFRIYNVVNVPDLSHLRWTIDYPEDLEFARQIYRRLYRGNVFRTKDILAVLEVEPHLHRTSADVVRNEGYRKSLESETERAEAEQPSRSV